MEQLTKNFTLEELCSSDIAKEAGISNKPTSIVIDNLTNLAVNILQPLRDWFGHPISISSGYRCPELNKKAGGVKNSQHLSGEAVDLKIDGDIQKGKKWFDYIRDNLIFDQLIWEHNSKGVYWVHVSFRKNNNRKQVINNLLKKINL